MSTIGDTVAWTEENAEMLDDIERKYLPTVRLSVKEIALQRARHNGYETPSYLDIFRAVEEYYGNRASVERQEKLPSIWAREYAFLLIVGFMTIVFGILGLFPTVFGAAPGDSQTVAFLDIAKIFAGAVVGGAAGATASSLAARSEQR